jgi:hypothetical protein
MATFTPVPAEHFIPDPTPLEVELLELNVLHGLCLLATDDLTLPRLRRLQREVEAALEEAACPAP